MKIQNSIDIIDRLGGDEHEELVDIMAKACMENIYGDILNYEHILHSDNRGREMNFVSNFGLVKGKSVFLLSGNRFYIVCAEGLKVFFTENKAQQYIDSFDI